MYRMNALDELVGESRAMVGLRHRVRLLLQRLSGLRRVPPILLRGETGTGKTLLARLIHRASPRANGPFVDINCAAIPETLLESELFGHERFAFTDAKHAKAGLFQTANGGVLFLDEIGLMPMSLQAKLLKAIDEGIVRRIGSTRNESVDVAIITATNEDLRIAMREKRFRPDLYSRIAVLSLELPPLRTRESDIVLLAESFLARACVDYGVPSKVLGSDARVALQTYAWPENVRELRNVMERVALEVDAATVTADALDLSRTVAPDTDDFERDEEHARNNLVEALERTKWNITRTAVLLGLSRNTVRARIQRYGLRPPGATTAEPVRTQSLSGDRGVVTVPDAPTFDDSADPLTAGTETIAVRIYTFARFAVFVGDHQILEDSSSNVPTRQLLKRLVTERGQQEAKGPAREADEPMLDASRRRSFSAMSALQDAFIEAGGEAMKNLLVGEGESVELSREAPIWIDADAFEHLVATSRRAAEPIALLRDANALYIGDYLPDDVSEGWSIARRARLRQTWIELQLLLARMCEQRGELDEAAAALGRLLAKDGADERAAQELVRLLLRRGRTAEARRVHERALHTLSELGIAPSPGSLKLERELHTDRPKHLPSGTVTFLLTDIEGSSRHWEYDVDAMQAVVARHDQLLSDGIGECSGTIVKKGEDGDSLLAVFGHAIDAVV